MAEMEAPEYQIEKVDHQTEERFREKYGDKYGIGKRLRYYPSGRDATICWMGVIEGIDFVGVCFDTKTGKNDGTYKGKRYFYCTDGYGHIHEACKIKPMEEAIALAELNTDDQPLNSLLNEVTRTFRCRVCISSRPTMVVCGGCGEVAVCEACKDGLVSGKTTTQCPICSFDWTWSLSQEPYLIRTKAFHSLIESAGKAQKHIQDEKRKAHMVGWLRRIILFCFC